VWQIGGHYQGGLILSPPGDPAAITFVTQTGSASNAGTYTFTDMAIGEAYDSRIVVVAVHSDGGNAALSSVTIGGNLATIITTGSTAPRCALAYLVVPTGTTATIVINWSTGVGRTGVATWSLTGMGSSTPIDTDAPATTTTTASVVTLDLPTGSFGVAAASHGGNNTASWDVGFEEYDVALETDQMRAAAVTLTGTGSNGVTITDTHVSDLSQIVGATWR
jgi:hypothetical protein